MAKAAVARARSFAPHRPQAEWGRRWITIDTSRVAIAIARQWILTAKYDRFRVKGEDNGGNGNRDEKPGVSPHPGFVYKTVPHITLKSIAQNTALDPIFAKRRMDYTPDPQTGMLSEEYVDVYGIPFTVIPFKGRPTKKGAPEDKPKNHVRALEERKPMEMRFPVVEGYAFSAMHRV